MGVLDSGSAHARPSARPPINTSGNFPAHISAESPSTFKNLPQLLRSHIRSFGTLGQLLKLPNFSALKCHSAGVGGVPECFLLIGILIFMLLWNPTTTPSGILNNGGRRRKKKERKINTKNSCVPKLLRLSHTLRSEQLLITLIRSGFNLCLKWCPPTMHQYEVISRKVIKYWCQEHTYNTILDIFQLKG